MINVNEHKCVFFSKLKLSTFGCREYKNTISFILTNADDDAELVEHLEVDQVPALM